MASAPREHEKRTLSAHLSAFGSVCACVLALGSPQEANVKPFCGTSLFFYFLKRGHFRLNGQGEDYSKAGKFCYIDYRLWEMNVWMCHAGGCVSAANAEVCR